MTALINGVAQITNVSAGDGEEGFKPTASWHLVVFVMDCGRGGIPVGSKMRALYVSFYLFRNLSVGRVGSYRFTILF